MCVLRIACLGLSRVLEMAEIRLLIRTEFRAAQIGGPMWAAPLHNKAFVQSMLSHVSDNAKDFKTSDRIKGMLTVALAVSLCCRGIACEIMHSPDVEMTTRAGMRGAAVLFAVQDGELVQRDVPSDQYLRVGLASRYGCWSPP